MTSFGIHPCPSKKIGGAGGAFRQEHGRSIRESLDQVRMEIARSNGPKFSSPIRKQLKVAFLNAFCGEEQDFPVTDVPAEAYSRPRFDALRQRTKLQRTGSRKPDDAV
jgi:hypothetical protein